jgi:filamentous hemagglutinin family protein
VVFEGILGGGGLVLAQIEPDGTLGTEITRDVIIRDILSDRIDGGTVRGANLFHSFEVFNVLAGRGVYFSNPDGIANIFSRVTGNDPSEILGRLGVLGEANLFLINPNGIIFGPNASLDIQGSFFATTADAIRLGNTGLFSATEPATSNLLAVNPSAFLFNAIAAQPILNQSQAASVIGQPNSNGGSPGLQVRAGQTLGLIGGDVRLEGGNLTAAGGRIELGSVASVGEVSLSQMGNRFVLGYDSIAEFGDISLSEGAFVDASGEGGGDVQIRAARLGMRQGSNIWADTLGASPGGEVRVNTTESVTLSERSRLLADVFGTGTGGNLTIDTPRLLVQGGARVSASTYDAGDAGNLTLETGELLVSQGGQISVGTFGEGNGGELKVNATQIELIGDNPINGTPSGLFASVGDNATGTGGNVTVSTQGLRIKDGATLSASTFGQGDAGNLRVVASDKIEVMGSSPQGNSSSIAAQVNPDATGNAGNLTLETGELLVSQGGQIAVGTFGEGNGGELKVNANQIELIGTNPIDGTRSGLFADVGPNATGTGGNVTLSTQGLRIFDGANLDASTSGKGNAGDLRVVASDKIEVMGSDPQENSSSIRAQVEPDAKGNAGNLTLETGELLVSQGGQIAVGTFGEGNGGQLNVNANQIELIGTNPIDGTRSGLFADVGDNATGTGGNVTLSTQGLRIFDGATLSASTLGVGNAGDLRVVATDSIEVIGSPQGNSSSIRAQVEPDAKGNAGNLTLETGELLVSQGGQISVGTFGEGNGGQLNVNANQIELIGTNPINGNRSALFADVGPNATGTGGNVTVSTQGLRIKDGAELSASTSGKGDAGNLTVVATDSIEVMGTNPEGFPSTINALVKSAATGNGGNLNINAPSILVTDKGELSVETVGNGSAGKLRIDTQRLRVTNDAVVSASTSSPNPDGKGGNLTINAKDALQLRNQGRIIAESTGAAPAGDITINTGRLTATDGTIATSTQRSAGGAITITAKDIRLFKDSDITTRVASGAGGGGDITLTANSIVAFDDSDILAFARDGQGGDITFNTRAFFGENYRPAPKGTDPVTLDNNDRVDINASGAVEGVITLPDTSAVQNNLTPLSENQIDTNSLIASSCIARRYEPQRGSFFITGTGGIPFRPGDAYVMRYQTGTVRGVPAEGVGEAGGDKKQTSSAQSSVTVSNTNEHSNHTTRRRWKMGDPIIEPTGIYRLPNGELIMSRECEQMGS